LIELCLKNEKYLFVSFVEMWIPVEGLLAGIEADVQRGCGVVSGIVCGLAAFVEPPQGYAAFPEAYHVAEFGDSVKRVSVSEMGYWLSTVQAGASSIDSVNGFGSPCAGCFCDIILDSVCDECGLGFCCDCKATPHPHPTRPRTDTMLGTVCEYCDDGFIQSRIRYHCSDNDWDVCDKCFDKCTEEEKASLTRHDLHNCFEGVGSLLDWVPLFRTECTFFLLQNLNRASPSFGRAAVTIGRSDSLDFIFLNESLESFVARLATKSIVDAAHDAVPMPMCFVADCTTKSTVRCSWCNTWVCTMHDNDHDCDIRFQNDTFQSDAQHNR
jgi:hypothetical protein